MSDSSFLKMPRNDGFARRHSAPRSLPKSRIYMAMLTFFLAYAAIAGRLVSLGLQGEDGPSRYVSAQQKQQTSRPDILDRNGEILATDIKSASLYAEPIKIPDADEVYDGLISVLPELDTPNVRKRLKSKAGFIWLKRELTMAQREAIHRLGLPGIGFRDETRRFYPGGSLAGHILGTVNIDNDGIAGMERYIDKAYLGELRELGFASNDMQMEPVRLSVDSRVQHALRDELQQAMERYQSIAAVGVVLKADTGEVIAMTSLPDFDPNDRAQALEKDRLNRATAGVYEMGSVFKGLTVAMALNSGAAHMGDSYDATKPIRVAGRTINDFHGKKRVLSVPEIFIYSSNIGTAKMMLAAGVQEQQRFLASLGLTTRLNTELPEEARPLLPPKWNELAAMTISYGHGLSVSPLQMAVAGAAMVNGGKFIPPTFLPRSAGEAEKVSKRIMSAQVSEQVRYLNRLNVLKGSGKRAAVPGYDVGGKTGTAQKVVDGAYVEGLYRTSFLSSFPMDKPEYELLIMLDEPKPLEGQKYATAGWNAVPTTANVVRRIAPMLGVVPDFSEDAETIPVSYQ
ncbi:peptidoglycan D,D-transpeptidase FtsI family protein [Polycladidibacter hongkongensis]|uniref:peptidoglycan D,D-transpeptidase FtsI family protein n=1 Tax=Polycladidibacter hongkongensis TaxID=1647556 RepID=UPI0009E6F581|nr:penicillin-binding protein 2 [Pseudovibrio hongkongensis]